MTLKLNNLRAFGRQPGDAWPDRLADRATPGRGLAAQIAGVGATRAYVRRATFTGADWAYVLWHDART